MPLRHESSLAADSTMSRSPSPIQTPATKRPVITYGRRRDLTNDPDSSVVSSTWSSSSRGSTYRTGPQDVDEEIPPSSDASRWHSENELQDDDAEGSDDAEEGPSKFQFSWKEKLKKMDEVDDFQEFIPKNLEEGIESKEGQPQARNEVSLSPQRPEISGTHTAPTSPNNPSPRRIPKNIFDGSLSSLTASSIPRDAPSSPGSSPLASPVVKSSGRVKRRGVVHDTDSESDQIEKKLLASNSPFPPQPVHTPLLHSSQTPPTSDDEMPAQISKTLSKGKGKASRRSVPPLEFHEGVSPSQPKSTTRGKRKKDGRVRPPTKKELEETAKDRVRIAAEQQVSIPKAQRKSLTMTSFFASLAEEKPKKEDFSSDPIADFSSPAQERTLPIQSNLLGHLPQPRRSVAVEEDVFGQSSTQPPSVSDQAKPLSDIPPLEDSDDELPPVGEVVREDAEQMKEARRKGLLDLKQRALTMQATASTHGPEMDEDDLEIVEEQRDPVQLVINADKERRSGKQKRVSDVRKQQLSLGGIGIKQQKAMRDAVRRGPEELTSILRGSPRITKKVAKVPLTQAELNKSLIKKVSEESKDATKKKEDEWVRRGGRLSPAVAAGGSDTVTSEALKAYAKKGMKAAEAKAAIREDDQEDGDDEDGSDEDWRPEMRGSASEEEEGSDKENGETKPDGDEEDVTMVDQEESAVPLEDDPAEEDENVPAPVPVRQRRPQIVQSDSEPENDENVPPPPSMASIAFGRPRLLSSSSSLADENLMPPPGQLGTRRFSLSSVDMDEHTDFGDNEEGEDKENQAISARLDVGSSSDPLSNPFFGDGARRGLTMTPPAGAQQRRRGSNASDDDPFASPVGPVALSPFAAKLKQFSPRPASRQPSPTLKPLFGGSSKGKEPAFSQFPDEDGGGLAPGPLLHGGFSQLFEAGTARQHTPKSRTPFSNLKGGDALGLTQDIDHQTAVHIDDKLKRKADHIFEKEQAYILENAVHKPAQDKPQLYVNDIGFLTQTRPDVSSPEVYRSAPSQSHFTQANGIDPSQRTQRHPLRTLSLSQTSDLEESPERRPLQRLRRAGSPTPPSDARGYRSSPSVSPSARKSKPLNAFDVLGKSTTANKDKPIRRLDRADFVEAEAQESDDEDKYGFGFVKKQDDDEEEEGEDLDKTLETLVDDKDMDEKTLARQLVMEKFKEQEVRDDEEIEKLHKRAIAGDLRRKRRNDGLGLDDSDDDSEEDEKNKKIRRSMHKKQKIDRDDIKALGDNVNTRAFYQIYAGDLMDDDKGLEFLQQTQDVDMADNDNTQSTAGNDLDDEEDDENDGSRYISRDEVIRQMREAAQSKTDDLEEPMDPRDVSWIDGQISDDESTQQPLVREAKVARRKPARPNGLAGFAGAKPVDLDGSLDMMPKSSHIEERERVRMQSWAKAESRSRTAGTTGRAVGGAAVTGHTSRARAKEGGGSLRSGQSAPSSSSSTAKGDNKSRKPLKSMPSMLASVGDRSSRFG